MIWVFLEIVLALAAAAVIVWWTFPRKDSQASAEKERNEED